MRFLYTVSALAMLLASPVAAQDKFRWLETPTDSKALDWARQQTQRAQTAIAAMPQHAEIEAELKALLAAGDPPPEYLLFGSVALRFQRSVTHPHGVLSVGRRGADGVPGGWRDVLDIDALRRAEGTAYEFHFAATSVVCAPPDHLRCILLLSPLGGDETELREFDLSTGRFVTDGFRAPASRTFVDWLDKDRLLIEHTVGDRPKLPTGWPASVAIWKRGTPLSAAKTVYTAKPTDAIMTIRATGEGADRVGVIMRAIDYSTIENVVVRSDGRVEVAPLPRKTKMILGNAGGGRIIAQLGEAAEVAGRTLPAESVVAFDTRTATPAAQRLSLVFTPSDGEFLSDTYTGIAPTRTGVQMVLNRRGLQRLVTATATNTGWRIESGKDEAVGTAVAIQASDPDSDAVVLKRAGFLLPSRLDLAGDGASTTLHSEQAAFDASGLVAELKSAPSKDGTPIDYYLVRPRKIKPGATPLLMTGYGAFGISLSPGYLDYVQGGKSIVPWLRRGGALAIPLIRGGGERGEAWHQAAIREKRQKSYDDFASVTEAIIKDGVTTPKHIGVFGSSNGGLLAAVMGTQRPDLYGAIVSDVPLTDLVRLPYMGMGAAWLNEYGDAKIPAMLASINAYSPYQNVVASKTYPPFFITVATSDNRVGPGHARKLAAALENAGATAYYLEDQEGGHGVSDPLSRPELMADRMTFLLNALK
ncbi:prolyl oligopeptidase family serine peptidase [Sphingomonas sp. CLY1604]|uniref:prolyl oligopeptidase family serine peptidase n=1 Tax=Sphingomonas sp. CLY1604 TaxID=3457786 RepID=UPI003FD77B51